VCYASLETLGEQLGMGVNTVRRHIRKLCKLGWLEDTTPDKRDGPHVYRDVGLSAIRA
jgi:predicted ArsR family transcriptional regulator